MNKILIIGNSGSGKSYLANKLSVDFGVPYHELDYIMWEPKDYSKKRPVDKRVSMIQLILEQGDWIVEGVFGDLAENFINDATELIWLDKNKVECLSNLDKRGPDYNKFTSKKDTEASFQNLKDWCSNYWDRSGTCCFDFHNKLYEEFPRLKRRVS